MDGVNCDDDGKYWVKDLIRVCVDKEVQLVDRLKLEHNLYFECWSWSDLSGNEHYLMPIHVIINMGEKYDDHQQRIMDADMTYPIILDENNTVRDGMHRLSKSFIENIEFIKCVYITRQELDLIKMK